jgi:hypothetical protein
MGWGTHSKSFRFRGFYPASPIIRPNARSAIVQISARQRGQNLGGLHCMAPCRVNDQHSVVPFTTIIYLYTLTCLMSINILTPLPLVLPFAKRNTYSRPILSRAIQNARGPFCFLLKNKGFLKLSGRERRQSTAREVPALPSVTDSPRMFCLTHPTRGLIN